ncbi:ABC transporter permease [Nocardia alba]|uniref:Transport permease protein n=1 Tax=Nocardia alba TaxID=225051 RepID=A0A4V6NCN8_9NOCA|nr:ABC transporter permease [Nocardia alba]TCJ95585.1 ABC-2 type transport system permease protein [Nocardia alba]
MTTTAPAPETVAPVARPHPSASADTAILVGRHLRLMSRRPASIIGAVVLPLIFATMFYVVFGTVVERRIGSEYGQYLLPAVILQAMLFTAMSAAILSVEDVTGGMIRRLRSMAVSPLAPVLGLVGAELTRALLTIAILLPAGALMGFRLGGGVLASIGFVLIALLFAAVVCTGFVAIGFAAGKVDTVQVITNVIFFPFLLVSNAFTPTEAFPQWLQPFVANQPLSRTADALRALAASDAALARPVTIAVLWLSGGFVVCVALAARAYRRTL